MAAKEWASAPPLSVVMAIGVGSLLLVLALWFRSRGISSRRAREHARHQPSTRGVVSPFYWENPEQVPSVGRASSEGGCSKERKRSSTFSAGSTTLGTLLVGASRPPESSSFSSTHNKMASDSAASASLRSVRRRRAPGPAGSPDSSLAGYDGLSPSRSASTENSSGSPAAGEAGRVSLQTGARHSPGTSHIGADGPRTGARRQSPQDTHTHTHTHIHVSTGSKFYAHVISRKLLNSRAISVESLGLNGHKEKTIAEEEGTANGRSLSEGRGLDAVQQGKPLHADFSPAHSHGDKNKSTHSARRSQRKAPKTRPERAPSASSSNGDESDSSTSSWSECEEAWELKHASWQEFSLFEGLSAEQQHKLIATMKPLEFKKGDTIITRGTVGTTMYFIDIGTASAMVRGEEVTQLRSGDYFGEMAFMATCRRFLKDDDTEIADTQVIRSADVVATSSCRMMEFAVRNFLTVLRNDLEGNRAVLRSLSECANARKMNLALLAQRSLQLPQAGASRPSRHASSALHVRLTKQKESLADKSSRTKLDIWDAPASTRLDPSLTQV
jgi:CRP-like cAMP-binding protein